MIHRTKNDSTNLISGPENVFLTGATGVLGAHLLKELLKTTKAKVYCLIRAQSQEHAMERLSTLIRVYDPAFELKEEFLSRAVPVIGDASLPKLGLSDSDYQHLIENTDVTLHVAALTNLFLNYRRIEPINVGGTRSIIEFVLKTNSKYLCHVSTHTITGDKVFDPTVCFKEKDLDIGQGFDHMTYQKSKFIAEQMVREATKQGLVWNIMRPGQIFGESTTGRYPLRESNVSGLFYNILKTVIDTSLAMESPSYFDVVPVDYVSRATIALGLNPAKNFETYHLVNPDAKSYSEVISIIKKLGFKIEVIPQLEYKRRLLNNEITFVDGSEYKSGTTSAFKWWFKRGIHFYESASTDCEYTASVLRDYGIFCPRVDEKLLGTYVEAAVRQNYFLAPTMKKTTGRLIETAATNWTEVSP